MKAKILGYAVPALIVAAIHLAEAQQTAKVSRIGFFVGSFAPAYASRIEAFRQGLHDLGYIEGKNIVVEYRYGERKEERFPDLAAELVSLKVDVIVTSSTSGVLAIKKATSTIPIVLAGLRILWGQGLSRAWRGPGETSQGYPCLPRS